MRRGALTVLSLILIAGSCGDDSSGTTATVTTAAPTTTAAVVTTAATTTSLDEVAARVAAATDYAGTYAGEWHNTTFDSSGTIAVDFGVDPATARATLVLDLGGNVFGAADPDPLHAEFDLTAAGPYAGNDPLFGDYTVAIDGAGHLTVIAPAVPGAGGLELTLEGDFADGEFTGAYVIAGLAEGTFTASRT
ncbi:MAG TPA: hypothetical protein DCY40_07400 [Actinobacteria bacterium]|nr:hypothetical protein [Actinomycetota bacterium]